MNDRLEFPKSFDEWMRQIDEANTLLELVRLEREFHKDLGVVAPALINRVLDNFERRSVELDPEQ